MHNIVREISTIVVAAFVAIAFAAPDSHATSGDADQGSSADSAAKEGVHSAAAVSLLTSPDRSQRVISIPSGRTCGGRFRELVECGAPPPDLRR